LEQENRRELILAGAGIADAEAAQVVLDRNGSTIVLQAYAPNIIRVALSLDKNGGPDRARLWFREAAIPASAGWTRPPDEQADVYRSSRLVVKVVVNYPGNAMAAQVDIAKLFNGSAPPANTTIQTPVVRRCCK